MDGGPGIQVGYELNILFALKMVYFRLGNVPLLDPPKHEFQEIPFYEWAGAPVYPEFEFQLLKNKNKTKTRLILELSPYTIQDLKRLEMDEWCFLYNE